MIVINKKTGQEHKVIQHRVSDGELGYDEWIFIKKTPKGKPVWKTLRDYYIKEEK